MNWDYTDLTESQVTCDYMLRASFTTLSNQLSLTSNSEIYIFNQIFTLKIKLLQPQKGGQC